MKNNKSHFLLFYKETKKKKFLKELGKIKYFPILNEQKKKEKIKHFQKLWKNLKISNFEYLMHLNHFSNRTLNNINTYYVFPWILAKYDQY